MCIDEDMSDQSLRTEVANLKERITELEGELKLEKNRGNVNAQHSSNSKCTMWNFVLYHYLCILAAAEIHDLSETNETKLVKLNQQLAEMSLKLMASQKAEKQLTTNSEHLSAKCDELELTNKDLVRQLEGMSATVEALREREIECVSEVKQGSTESGEQIRDECETLKQQVNNHWYTVLMHVHVLRALHGVMLVWQARLHL